MANDMQKTPWLRWLIQTVAGIGIAWVAFVKVNSFLTEHPNLVTPAVSILCAFFAAKALWEVMNDAAK